VGLGGFRVTRRQHSLVSGVGVERTGRGGGWLGVETHVSEARHGAPVSAGWPEDSHPARPQERVRMGVLRGRRGWGFVELRQDRGAGDSQYEMGLGLGVDAGNVAEEGGGGI